MSAIAQYKADIAAQELRAAIAGMPGRNMVSGSRNNVFVTVQTGEIDLFAQYLEGTRPDQWVGLNLIQEITVQLRRQAGSVIVPIQNIEYRGFIAHQVIVDYIIPDQVIGSHPVEYLG